MRARFHAFLFTLVLGATLVLAAAQAPGEVPLDILLDRAGWYLDYFVDEFENVVAEERYVQDSSVAASQLLAGHRRTRRSDRANGAVGYHARAASRVALRFPAGQVAGDRSAAAIPRRHRRGRRRGPRSRSSGWPGCSCRPRRHRRATRWRGPNESSEEGARYNLGSMRSTLGNPVLALGVLQKTYQQRFRFTLGKEDRSAGPGVSVVEYQEVSSPAMIRGEAGLDLMAHGRLWIDAVTGRVLKTELQVQQPSIRAIVTTTFQFEERSGIAVPQEMREQYTFANGNRVHAVATYGRFRRFDVSAEEDIHTPAPTVIEPWTGMAFVELPAGRFTMGSASSESGRNDDEVLHDVEITRPFLLGRYEVTQQEWRTVMGTSPSQFASCGLAVSRSKTSPSPMSSSSWRSSTRTTPHQARRRRRFNSGCRPRRSGSTRAARIPPVRSRPARTSRPLRRTTTANIPTHRLPPARPASSARSPPRSARFRSTSSGWPTCTATSGSGPPTGTARTARRRRRTSIRRGAPSGEKRVIRGGSWLFDANSARCGLRYTHAPKDRGYSLGVRIAATRAR